MSLIASQASNMDPVSEAEPLTNAQLPRVAIRFCTQLS